MPAPTVRVDHQQMAQIAQRFVREAESTARATQEIVQRHDQLKSGDWYGDSATRFFNEMESAILPAMKRLSEALAEAAQVTQRISAELKRAEDEVAALMPRQGEGNAPVPGVDGPPAAGGPGGENPGGTNWQAMGVVLQPKVDLRSSDGKWSDKQSVAVKIDLAEGALINRRFAGEHGTAAIGEVKGGLKFGLNEDGKFSAGAFGEATLARIKAEGAVLGGQTFGWTVGGEVKAVSAEAFVGVKDNSFGASVGVNLASVKGETGFNLFGYNIGLSAEAGAKFEAGFKVGAQNEIKFGPISLGISFGRAKP
jgi:WXG100 family type VII secretion target